MRKNISFAVAAFAFVLAVIVLATSNATSDTMRPKAGIPHVVPADAFLPSKALRPYW